MSPTDNSERDAWRKRAEEAESALGCAIKLLLEYERQNDGWNLLYNENRVFLKQMEREYASFGFSYPQSVPVIEGLKRAPPEMLAEMRVTLRDS